MHRLATYQEWEHCITVLCGLPLTPFFVEQRLAELKDPRNSRTQQFVMVWGDAHHGWIVSWFEEAKRRLAAA